MKTVWIVALGLLLSPTFGTAGEPVAKVGDIEVTAEELRGYLNELPPQQREALSRDPSLMTQTVRATLVERLALKEAKGKRFDERPEVKAQLERSRDHAAAELYLLAVSQVPDSFPSEAEVQAVYDANKASFVTLRRVRLAQILVAAARGGALDARLGEVTGKLKAKGADFSSLAKDYSDQKTEAAQGGEVGWAVEAQLLPAVARALAGKTVGTVTEPVHLDDGWHIFKLLEAKAGGEQLPLAQVRKPLVEQMRRQKSLELRQAYIAELLRQNPPAINEMAISKLVK